MRRWPEGMTGRASHWITELRLEEVVGEKVGTLSYGLQKRVALATALASESSAVILDEPVSGVDPLSRGVVGEVLQVVAREKLVIIVEHDLEFVRHVADEAIGMESGVIARRGAPGDVADWGCAL